MKQLNWYQIFGNTHKIPDGRTVLPTDDIQIWLNCANIWDKSYTTLAEVLADTDTLLALITSNNAVDYMVRSTTWAVSDAYVPKMTSATTPSGVVASSTPYSASDYAYSVFDQNSSTYFRTQTTGNNYISYQFTEPKKANCLYIQTSDAGDYGMYCYQFAIEGSNDGLTWDTLLTVTERDSNYIKFYDNNTAYYRYRIANMRNRQNGTNYAFNRIEEMQFYSASITADATAMQYIGSYDYAAETLLSDATWNEAICKSEYFDSVLNEKNPTMTSNTAPKGECLAGQGMSASEPAWKAFDGDTNTRASASSGALQVSVAYKFERVVKPYLAYVYSAYSGYYQYKIRYSDDNVTWSDATDFSTPTWDSPYILLPIANEHQYWGIVRKYTSADSGIVREVNFYGREIGGVQTWLRSAGITDKLYTTLSEVLADSTTLTALMSSHSAVDYLVTAKGWADDICADSGAMTAIGNNNYAADTLLADDTWCEAICNSEYFESVLNVKVPTMTSNTTPSGECYSYYPDTRSQYAAYKAFDNDSTTWNAFVNHTPINEVGFGYGFTKPVRLVAFSLSVPSFAVGRATKVSIKGSSDKSVWTQLATYNNPSTADGLRHLIDVPLSEYQYFAFFIEALGSGYATGNLDFDAAQFYGREDV